MMGKTEAPMKRADRTETEILREKFQYPEIFAAKHKKRNILFYSRYKL